MKDREAPDQIQIRIVVVGELLTKGAESSLVEGVVPPAQKVLIVHCLTVEEVPPHAETDYEHEREDRPPRPSRRRAAGTSRMLDIEGGVRDGAVWACRSESQRHDDNDARRTWEAGGSALSDSAEMTMP